MKSRGGAKKTLGKSRTPRVIGLPDAPSVKKVSPGKLVVAALTCMCSFLLIVFKHPSIPELSGDPGRSIPGNDCRTFPGLNL